MIKCVAGWASADLVSTNAEKVAIIRSGDTDLAPDGGSDEDKLKTLLDLVAANPAVSKWSLTKATGWNNENVT